MFVFVMDVSAEQLRQLREKYTEIRRLRLEAESVSAPDPKPAMRRLAERFPGALRELDGLPMGDVEGRIRALTCALGGEPAPSWAAILCGYHALFRACLRIKRTVALTAAAEGRSPELDDVRRHLRDGYLPDGDEPSGPSLLPFAATLLKPPEGRLHPWVVAQVAERLGVPSEAVEAAFHPA